MRLKHMSQIRLKKERDNYHVILIAKNYAGFKELNTLVSNPSIDRIQNY